MPGIAEIGGKTSCGTSGFEVPVAALEVQKVGGVVGCVLRESESVCLDEKADGGERDVWKQFGPCS